MRLLFQELFSASACPLPGLLGNYRRFSEILLVCPELLSGAFCLPEHIGPWCPPGEGASFCSDPELFPCPHSGVWGHSATRHSGVPTLLEGVLVFSLLGLP